jgi:hypothetical protein
MVCWHTQSDDSVQDLAVIVFLAIIGVVAVLLIVRSMRASKSGLATITNSA